MLLLLLLVLLPANLRERQRACVHCVGEKGAERRSKHPPDPTFVKELPWLARAWPSETTQQLGHLQQS